MQSLTDLLARMVGPGLGLEVVSCVSNISKGSRLAVSTSLLASIIAAGMRATGQARSLTGALSEDERRLVAARAIPGEWLGGSGGGWQDSGGVWPGIKLIEGARPREGDAEFGVSRGRLLPRHRVLDRAAVPDAARLALQESIVLVHGGMAQNVGPILEMVTEEYLFRSETEWEARGHTLRLLDDLLAALGSGDVRALGAATTRNFREPLQAIIPWASNYYTETLIERAVAHFGADFWGFLMLGGMSGRGMGFLVAPRRKAEAQEYLQTTMSAARRELQHALPFAMEPVVYDFAINKRGTGGEVLQGEQALMPAGYYGMQVPGLLRQDPRQLPALRREELARFGAICRAGPELSALVDVLLVHNVDTLGAALHPALLGLHMESGRCLTFEVIPRRVEDQGGGLARVDGRLRLVEGLALPREEDEFALSYYNTLTTWVDIDRLLAVFGLGRGDLSDGPRVAAAVARRGARVPTYLALKEVKKRWGHGQEDIFPVCQFEKLWGDMTAQAEVACGFVAVPRPRGQQLKDPAQLDGWLRDGSAAHVEALCAWE